MRPPRVVKTIAGDVPIAIGDIDDRGEYRPALHRITLQKGQSAESERRTLLHELGHHMVDHLGLRTDVDKDSEERLCDVFAAYVIELIRRNPRLVDYLRD